MSHCRGRRDPRPWRKKTGSEHWSSLIESTVTRFAFASVQQDTFHLSKIWKSPIVLHRTKQHWLHPTSLPQHYLNVTAVGPTAISLLDYGMGPKFASGICQECRLDVLRKEFMSDEEIFNCTRLLTRLKVLLCKLCLLRYRLCRSERFR